MEDARAIERECPSVALVDVWLGATGQHRSRIFYGNERTKQLGILGATENWAAVNFAKLELGRLFIGAEVEHRRNVVLLGNGPWQSLFPSIDPIGKKVRISNQEFTVIGALGKRPSPGGFSTEVDDFAIIPYGTYEKIYGKVLKGSAKISAGNFNPAVFRTGMIAVVPRVGMRDAAMQEVEGLMRARHRLKLDEPNDFDLATQDAVLKVWEQISQATFLALVVISSIALMVGGIGVMAIMMISVTERTREIGVRKALGARRREILWQFLIEAVFLTSTRRPARHPLRQLDRPAGPLRSPASRSRCPGGPSPSASASRPASASSSGCSRRSKRRGWIRSRRCGTSRLSALSSQLASSQLPASVASQPSRIQRSVSTFWCAAGASTKAKLDAGLPTARRAGRTLTDSTLDVTHGVCDRNRPLDQHCARSATRC